MVATTDVMVRTQIQLEEEQHRQLLVRGARDGLGLAEQVREAVHLYLAQRGATKPAPLSDALGKFRPRSSRGLKAHDRDYADTLR
jgi:hypothetical protein